MFKIDIAPEFREFEALAEVFSGGLLVVSRRYGLLFGITRGQSNMGIETPYFHRSVSRQNLHLLRNVQLFIAFGLLQLTRQYSAGFLMDTKSLRRCSS